LAGDPRRATQGQAKSFLPRSFADRAGDFDFPVTDEAIYAVLALVAGWRRCDLVPQLHHHAGCLAGDVSGHAVVVGQRGHASNQHDNEADKKSHSTPRSQFSGIAVGLNPL
jgi:hypothetical protein